ncbi:hypothetical protein GUITHDRAFT_132787 [Guillardia theta CCMP2712]|uniref:Ubiquitin-like protease family profile domain-containing protein n=1 Tax=Guillardia theta (strain CCMP2712) TaxID=905079 RepID=L1K014_GUITC|nr:hypothetical protein GUITHDRAFT_132787 [Guillardia theta CCMP2712]EKX53713.1 hypothetical protein GUITHDRAFT_132787 [Guillardia theta CCMP2712]|eukprot:XP_005840693.1 hypothetical protein GUITHDRAFT_132787 [Guillardia theta CCMP2712]
MQEKHYKESSHSPHEFSPTWNAFRSSPLAHSHLNSVTQYLPMNVHERILLKTALLERKLADVELEKQLQKEEYEAKLQALTSQLSASAVTEGPKTPLELARGGSVDGRLLDTILAQLGPKELIADRFDIDVTREKLECMRDGVWLNSEVITWWLEWWREEHGGGSQGKMPKPCEPGKEKEMGPRCWFANTYFYTKLLDEENKVYSYKNVRRWTKKINVFDCDKMIIPINQDNVHWFCACIDFKNKRTEVYDSLGSNKHEWIKDELKDKQSVSPVAGRGHVGLEAPLPSRDEVPRQLNCCDCGVGGMGRRRLKVTSTQVFACMFAAYLSIGRKFDFSQKDIDLIRRWMIQTIYKEGVKMGQVRAGLCSV